jgi:hypothetical protein
LRCIPDALRDAREQARKRRQAPQLCQAFLAARQMGLQPPSFGVVRRAKYVDAK